MNCYHCKHELVWGEDQNIEDEEFSMVTNLTCPNCGSMTIVYYPNYHDNNYN